jgi:RNA polymerase sigma-70 factor, ECF subfamily
VLVVSDVSEFERMFRAYHGAVFRYALRRVGPSGVQDAVAETFMVAWRRRQEVSGDALPWLLGVARRVCANQLRSRARETELRSRIATEPRDSTYLDPHAAGDELLVALRRLSESDREALMLVAWDDLSNAQAARVLGCSAAAFAVRLHRARRRLRRALDTSRETHPTLTKTEEALADG